MDTHPIYKTSKADPFDIAELPARNVAVLTDDQLEKLWRQLIGTIRLVGALRGYDVTIVKRRN